MAEFHKICLFSILISITTKTSSSTLETLAKDNEKEELIATETRDGKLEIIKKIKKINNDGSYTIGYEADDGSFKIESRDVLGHIKGTYGFLDDSGQIKRVTYTSTNASEIITTQESPTVVQRIPSKNRTTTKRPAFFSSFSSTPPIPTTSPHSVVQNIARRRLSLGSSSTTIKPSQSTSLYSSPSVSKPNFITYTSAPPRVLVQGRSPLVGNNTPLTKSEGQIIRPEIVTVKPTNGLTLKRLEIEKPVNEESEPEVRSNILRRQLSSQNNHNYNVREQLQQSSGHDISDIYTNSMSAIHPKPPLFTTTSRPGPVAISTTPFPLSVARPMLSYPEHYQSRSPQEFDQQQQSYSQQTTTSRPYQHHSTPTAIVQIPANKEEEAGPFVAFRHPSNGNAVFVPLSQVQGKLVPVDQLHAPNDDQRQYIYQEPVQNTRVIEIEQQKAIVRRLPSTSVKPIPVKLDENEYVRDVPQQGPLQYPYPIPITTRPINREPVNTYVPESITKYVETDIDNDIDSIQPPVSTRDLQKLLQQLIMRQSRLEKVSMLTRQPEMIFSQHTVRPRPLYSQQVPLFYQKPDFHERNGAIAFFQDPRLQLRRPHDSNHNLYIDQQDSLAYRPNRRVARLQPSSTSEQLLDEQDKNEYLPPNVREMLLLRMLQLAINPALPIDENDIEIVSSPDKKKQVRNVEILGEEIEMTRRADRVKRFTSFGV